MATICAKNKTILDTSWSGEAEWFNRMAATDEGAAQEILDKKTKVKVVNISFFLHLY